MAIAHNLGFPRIGKNREMKKAVEAYWKGELSQQQLLEEGKRLRAEHWAIQQQAGIQQIPVGDFTWYDQVLEMSATLGAVPERFGKVTGNVGLDTFFRMARGRAPTGKDAPACEMTKWFDTNYHYIVPEFEKSTEFRLAYDKFFNDVDEAKALGLNAKPVIVGPLTYLWLGKTKDESINKLELAAQIVPVYEQILARFAEQGCEWVQIDEPILALDLPREWLEAMDNAYKQLSKTNIKILLATYFGELRDNLQAATQLDVNGLHIDTTFGAKEVTEAHRSMSSDKVLSIGVVNGRNIWRTDLNKQIDMFKSIASERGNNLWIAPTCSLQHVPVDLSTEGQHPGLDEEVKSWLAYAVQKLDEVVIINKALHDGKDSVKNELAASDKIQESRRTSSRIHKQAVKDRVAAVTKKDANRDSAYPVRAKAQKARFNLPLFPTTTIGSFPQTAEIRQARRDFKNGTLSAADYEQKMHAEIQFAVEKQVELDIDVLVHGEAERNDMVEYFGELLEGFAFSRNGWVQSYGSRCVKPPIIFGDVTREKPMTIDWTTYAQSLTDRPMKGMLTGPVTILCWSFVRDDQPYKDTTMQIALALRDEVTDLETAGIGIIQMDEPAFREGLPLRNSDKQAYLDWAVETFKVSTCSAKDDTQIHTHMCYSEFNETIEAIAAMDADVITIETSRSDMELLKAFENFNYPNEIGPGVYDIHSPIVPTEEEVIRLMTKAIHLIPQERLWINPDCGLKTRGWPETIDALKIMVDAAKHLRTKAQVKASATA